MINDGLLSLVQCCHLTTTFTLGKGCSLVKLMMSGQHFIFYIVFQVIPWVISNAYTIPSIANDWLHIILYELCFHLSSIFLAEAVFHHYGVLGYIDHHSLLCLRQGMYAFYRNRRKSTSGTVSFSILLMSRLLMVICLCICVSYEYWWSSVTHCVTVWFQIYTSLIQLRTDRNPWHRWSSSVSRQVGAHEQTILCCN